VFTPPAAGLGACGLDPDTNHIGFAILNPQGRVLRADLIECADLNAVVERRVLDLLFRALPATLADLVPFDLICVEGQRWIHLAQVAGGCVSALKAHSPTARIFFPFPSEWKGTIKKEIFTKRIMKTMRLTSCTKTNQLCQDGVPISRAFPRGKHTHMIDAIGLARWAQLRMIHPR
jgi:hypothetical protein